MKEVFFNNHQLKMCTKYFSQAANPYTNLFGPIPIMVFVYCAGIRI